MILRWKRVYNLVFENKIVKHFLRAIPGFDDYSIIGKAWFHTTEEKRKQPVWDTLVFDMPASGHSLSMLRIPQVIVDTVPEGPLTRDARTLLKLLRDPKRTSIALVTLAEEMPANEARELTSKLKSELDLSPDTLVVNQLFPDHAPPGSPTRRVLEALRKSSDKSVDDPVDDPVDEAQDPDVAAVLAHAELSQSRRDLQRHHLEALSADLTMPMVKLPLLFSAIDRSQISVLADEITRQLG